MNSVTKISYTLMPDTLEKSGFYHLEKSSITDAKKFHKIALKVYNDVNKSLERG